MNQTFQLNICRARKRGYYLVVSSDEGDVVIHSRYDPARQAEGWAGEIKDSHEKLLLVGGGLGYFPAALEERGVSVTVIEPLPEGKRSANVPFSDLVAEDQVHFVDPTDGPMAVLDEIRPEEVQGARVLLHPGYDHLLENPGEYLDSLHLMSRGKIRNVQSRYRFCNRIFNNFLEVLPRLESMRPLSVLDQQYEGCVGVIAGAGPSLEDALNWIPQVRDSMVLVAVDSAASVLINAGIRPDFVITMDPQPDNAQYIEGVEACGSLVGALSATPEYFDWGEPSDTVGFYPSDDAEGDRITSSVLRWFRQFIDGEGYLQSGGSVASTAVDFLRILGVGAVGITGVDHAFTFYRAVTRGSKREQAFLQSLNRFTTLADQHLTWIFETVPSQGKQLKTTQSRRGDCIYTMDEYEVQNAWFEQAAEVLDIPCLDLRSDGLPMEGWEVIDRPERLFDSRFDTDCSPPELDDMSTYEVDWDGLNRATRTVFKQIPEDVGTFCDIVDSKQKPSGEFWEYFAEPLLDYLATKEPEDWRRETESFYGDLTENFERLREILAQHS